MPPGHPAQSWAAPKRAAAWALQPRTPRPAYPPVCLVPNYWPSNTAPMTASPQSTASLPGGSDLFREQDLWKPCLELTRGVFRSGHVRLDSSVGARTPFVSEKCSRCFKTGSGPPSCWGQRRCQGLRPIHLHPCLLGPLSAGLAALWAHGPPHRGLLLSAHLRPAAEGARSLRSTAPPPPGTLLKGQVPDTLRRGGTRQAPRSPQAFPASPSFRTNRCTFPAKPWPQPQSYLFWVPTLETTAVRAALCSLPWPGPLLPASRPDL